MTENIHDFIHDLGLLKRKDRAGWVKRGIENPESVAEHNFRVGMVAFALGKRFGFDPFKVGMMGVIHDAPEYKAPDYTPHDDITFEYKFR